MKIDAYPYLKDPKALAEIRKHKWLESQRRGEEVGFATAAVDWIKNHGQDWKKIHAQEYKDRGVFIERRKYRRFQLEALIKLMKENKDFAADPVDISFFGLSSRMREYVDIGSEVEIKVILKKDRKKEIKCKGTIERVVSVGRKSYEVFLKFDEQGQEQLEKLDYISRG